eukprot:9908598-Lingulodinium_polyedra.AAC.1
MPFCKLPRAAARLRLMKLARTHSATSAGLLQRCCALSAAGKEALGSVQRCRVLSATLCVGNYISHMGGKQQRHVDMRDKD